jgi:glycosyltransferase involved in cell wall biosynthesis
VKIAITGTRGIPNYYGGFEQFCMRFAPMLVSRGHIVFVYNPYGHTYKDITYKEVYIIKKWLSEKWLGPGANYVYDFLCLKDAIARKVDVILECGYASAAPSYPFLRPGRTQLITHMDGMEWQRAKWRPMVQKWIRKAEAKAIRFSDAIVCDHPQIAEYYKSSHSVDPYYIAYGADILENPDIKVTEQYDLEPFSYYISIARLEPENNIRMIINGFLAADTGLKLLLIGDLNTGYGSKLETEFAGSREIIFIGGIFNDYITSNLRHFSKGVFHGHSVGGTNPSILEAMASGAGIIAHENKFNRHILGENAEYFNSPENIKEILLQTPDTDKKTLSIKNNIDMISKQYQWSGVVDKYEALFSLLSEKS